MAATQAARIAKKSGKLSAAEERFFEELSPDIRMNWQEVLRKFMTSHIKNDYSFIPPNKKFLWMDMIMPSLRGEALGELVIAIDTSCSVQERELNEFASQTNIIMESCQPEKVTVIYCDSKVCGTETFTPDQYPIFFRPVGGGGTRFSPVYDWVKKNGVDPLCLLYFTDLYCNDYPSYSPPFPSLFVSTTEWGYKSDGSLDCPYMPPAHMGAEVVQFLLEDPSSVY